MKSRGSVIKLKSIQLREELKNNETHGNWRIFYSNERQIRHSGNIYLKLSELLEQPQE